LQYFSFIVTAKRLVKMAKHMKMAGTEFLTTDFMKLIIITNISCCVPFVELLNAKTRSAQQIFPIPSRSPIVQLE
jgi:hypothetical protein